MKILFYRYNSICEPGILSAFQQLGHSVQEITEEIYRKDISPKEQIELISEKLFETHFDFVFSINFYPGISEVCNLFKIPYACWIVDSPVLSLYTKSIKNPWNRIFLFDQSLYQEFSPQNPQGIFYLPLACDLSHYDSVCQNADSASKEKFSSDISFVGSLYTEKCPYNALSLPEYIKGYCDSLIESQILIYGYNFLKDCITEDIVSYFKEHTSLLELCPDGTAKDYKSVIANYYLGNKISEQERLRTFSALSPKYDIDLYTNSDTQTLPHIHHCGTARTLTEMPLIYHFSKINLNITTKPIQTGLPLRMFDIMGCGGFCLSNYQLEIPELFDIGADLDVYTSMEELDEKLHYYLSHEKERREIARNGYEKIKSRHTYEIRLQEMINNM